MLLSKNKKKNPLVEGHWVRGWGEALCNFPRKPQTLQHILQCFFFFFLSPRVTPKFEQSGLKRRNRLTFTVWRFVFSERNGGGECGGERAGSQAWGKSRGDCLFLFGNPRFHYIKPKLSKVDQYTATL